MLLATEPGRDALAEASTNWDAYFAEFIKNDSMIQHEIRIADGDDRDELEAALVEPGVLEDDRHRAVRKSKVQNRIMALGQQGLDEPVRHGSRRGRFTDFESGAPRRPAGDDRPRDRGQ